MLILVIIPDIDDHTSTHHYLSVLARITLLQLSQFKSQRNDTHVQPMTTIQHILPYQHLDIFAGLHSLACSISTIFTKSSKSEIMCAFYNVLSLVLFVHVGVLEDFKIQLLGLGFLGPPSDSGQNPDLSGAGLSTTFT